MHYQKILMVANCGNDPEMRFLPNGTPTTQFRIVSNHSYTDVKGERKESAEWFTAITYKGLAETCNNYLHKGSRVFVEGRLRSRSWDGNDGQKRFVNEVIVQKIIFLDKPKDAKKAEEAVDNEDEGLLFE